MGPAPPFDVFQSSTLLFYFEHVLLLLFSSALKMCFSPQDTQHSSIDVLKAGFFFRIVPPGEHPDPTPGRGNAL